jgi:hypothetical protein
MPTPKTLPEIVDFDGLIDNMAERVFGSEGIKKLSLDEKEKFTDFFRNLIKGALAFVEAKTKERFSFKQSVYSVVDTVHQSGRVTDLRVFERVEGKAEPSKICSIPMKESSCKGMPNGSLNITETKNIPTLVERKKIDVLDVKPAKFNFRIPINRVLAELKKKNHGFDTHFEVQLKPESK